MEFQVFWNISRQLFQGIEQTILVTFFCFLTGMLTGLVATCLQRLALPVLNPLIRGFSFVFRGVPIYVLVFLVYFGLPTANVKVPPLVAMNLSLGLVTGAYLIEVFRTALQTIDVNEIVAAEAMGMSKLDIFFWIEIPQMLRLSIPGIANEFTSTLKSSPFAYIIGIPEITRQAVALTATTDFNLYIYASVAALYFLIYMCCTFLSRQITRKFGIIV
ncbi:amino acid ABC transporter permease [Burkholderia ubonensis]|uniref:Amino acid ABC transporter ATP-binding protein n=1 Tax=Burkholderia ubonensis TaxID=101571 RepID=A0A106ILA6_9BURK|nr:amino acid ABC transporter permease [Burkholderia ubonensis]KVZ35189.1 amino acid ABC transporter ATP-binding protein [Burkholderia ubonensis]KWA78767.1 amino acid ABC transporter ATP-binding protein [Burkholderia ubonensis]KWB93262.1 amino acid ABC transporter ATP-binding protein [Burkholderia ubonensis]KWZ58442.1 amino acid ABC transporter ATP-binding protein [Burkholderia ubonensis]